MEKTHEDNCDKWIGGICDCANPGAKLIYPDEELEYVTFKKPKKKKKPLTESQLKEAKRKLCVKDAKEISKKLNPVCAYCGIGRPQRQVHSHHIFSEGLNKAMSADVDNLLTLCSLHHQALVGRSQGGFSFHGSPSEATNWLIENMHDKYYELRDRSRITVPLDMNFWINKRTELKQQLKNL